jgi:hypothetical protein
LLSAFVSPSDADDIVLPADSGIRRRWDFADFLKRNPGLKAVQANFFYTDRN